MSGMGGGGKGKGKGRPGRELGKRIFIDRIGGGI